MWWLWWWLLTFVAAFVLAAYAGSDSTPLSAQYPWQFRLAARLRTPVLMFFVVPISFLWWLRNVLAVKLQRLRSRGDFAASQATHGERVQAVVEQVKAWSDGGRKSRMRTARATWASMSTKLGDTKNSAHLITTSHLNQILAVDAENLVATLEPGVTMGVLTETLVPLGLSLELQVEMESITVGGLASGFGIETNSHSVGFFQETLLELEFVTADAKVMTVDAKTDPEVFYAWPWSCGTMGFLTKLKVKLMRTKPYVHVRYIPTHSVKEFASKLKEIALSPTPPRFLEATLYTKDKAVIQCGDFVDPPTTAADKAKINGINWWFKPFYYRWVETFLEKGAGEDIVPLKHYFHRFTRSVFWELEDMIPFSNHPLYRFFWGWLGAPEISLLKLAQGPVIRKASVYAHVVQESIMPVSLLETGVEKFDKWFGVYPLLAFPVRIYDRGPLSGFLNPRKENNLPGKDYGLYVDLGAYGPPRAVREGKMWDAKTNVREMEHWTRDVGGFQAFYTDLFCTPDEFRSMFSHTLLDKCRARLGALDAFPDVYDKIKPEKGIVDLEEELKASKKTS